METNIEINPIILINFKTYPESTGDNALVLARICEKVAFETGTDIRVAVSAPDIFPVSRAVSIPVYAEHVDEYPLGRNTGAILPETVKIAGATGTLLNHSEHRIPMKKLEESIKRAANVSLTTVVCVESIKEAEQAVKLSPDYIAIEPPELIGGNISVSTAKPELIQESVHAVKDKSITQLLVGAGIKTKADVQVALRLGADGVLLASGVTLAEDPEKALRGLIP